MTGSLADDASPIFLPLRKVAAVGIGNALEFYDFLTYSFFAIQIGHCFFPPDQTSNGLLFSLATFGAGFLFRPLGGVVIGRFGDKAGRKPAMILSFTLMGGGVTAMALIPSYAQIGLASPILLLLCRLVQGFALGGEVGPSTAFLIEVAPPRRRGLYVAMQYMTADMAVLIAGLVGFTLSSLLTPAALDAWGWRLAFIAGAAVVPVGLGMRRSLPETMTAAAEIPASRPTPGPPVRLIVLGLLMLGGSTIASYVINYTTTYAQDSLHLTANVAFGATIVSGVSFVVADLFSGLLSDRIGRKPVMLASSVLTLASTIAAYAAMTSSRSVLVLFASTAWLSALQSFLSAPVLIAVAESLPKSMRSAGLATLYAVAISIFGGTTQVVIKLLIDKTGSPLAPAWYMTAALAVGAIAMALFPESAPAKTGPPTAPRPIQ